MNLSLRKYRVSREFWQILRESVHYVILNKKSRTKKNLLDLNLGDIGHLSCQIMFFCFIFILDCYGIALSIFYTLMRAWWRFNISISMTIDPLVLELQWKQKKLPIWQHCVNRYFPSGRVSEPHIWATMMSLVSIYSESVDWDGQGSLWFFLLALFFTGEQRMLPTF